MIIVIFFRGIKTYGGNLKRIDNVIDIRHQDGKLYVHSWDGTTPTATIYELDDISHYQVIP